MSRRLAVRRWRVMGPGGRNGTGFGGAHLARALIVEGRVNAWFKERVLLEQGFVRDDKQTVTQFLGDATLVRYAQVYIGG